MALKQRVVCSKGPGLAQIWQHIQLGRVLPSHREKNPPISPLVSGSSSTSSAVLQFFSRPCYFSSWPEGGACLPASWTSPEPGVAAQAPQSPLARSLDTSTQRLREDLQRSQAFFWALVLAACSTCVMCFILTCFTCGIIFPPCPAVCWFPMCHRFYSPACISCKKNLFTQVLFLHPTHTPNWLNTMYS